MKTVNFRATVLHGLVTRQMSDEIYGPCGESALLMHSAACTQGGMKLTIYSNLMTEFNGAGSSLIFVFRTYDSTIYLKRPIRRMSKSAGANGASWNRARKRTDNS